MTDGSERVGRARRRVVIGGRVQGVFFRDTCRRKALARGIAGSAWNRPDGKLEAVFEGDPGAVEALVAWCRQGPDLAVVESVEVTEEEPVGEEGFRIR